MEWEFVTTKRKEEKRVPHGVRTKEPPKKVKGGSVNMFDKKGTRRKDSLVKYVVSSSTRSVTRPEEQGTEETVGK